MRKLNYKSDLNLQTVQLAQVPGTVYEQLYMRLHGKRCIFLFEEVSEATASSIAVELLALDQESHDDIWLFVNSPGGTVTDGLAIIDMMHLIKSKINTVCCGMAGSMAAFIFASAEKGRRYMLKNSYILLHQPSGQAEGATADVVLYAKELERIRTTLFEILAESTGKSKRKIMKDLNRDFTLSAQEAIKYGVADQLLEALPF